MADTQELVDHLFRHQAGQMVAWLTRIFGPAHLELAEEVVQDALLKALQQWPFSGIPENPAGWLFRVARNGALDVIRRRALFREREGDIARQLEDRGAAAGELPVGIKDDELRMVFMCCHPELPQDSRVALSLKTVGGFSTAEIARAFLSSESTIAQRIVRAKRTLKEKKIAFEVPAGLEATARLDSVLEVIYLMFNEGYTAHGGDTLVRQDLCFEAIRLGRLVATSGLGPSTGSGQAASAHALVSLMAFQASRIPARINDKGELVLLEHQDRRLWDARLIGLAFRHLEWSAEGERMTTYHVEAAIAAIHGAAPHADKTDWRRALSLYDDLLRLNHSPVVRLNRAVALARVEGAAAALKEVATLEAEPALADYYLLPAVKGTLLMELGDREGATTAYLAALERPCNAPERKFLAGRLRSCRA